jgi:PKD repeat protein
VVNRSTTSIANVSVPERAVVTEDSERIEATFEELEGPSAEITANATTVSAGESIRFSAEQSSENVRAYLWGGPFQSRNETVTHTFEEPGNYSVSLTVVDEYGNRDQATLNVTVEAADGNASIGRVGSLDDVAEVVRSPVTTPDTDAGHRSPRIRTAPS